MLKKGKFTIFYHFTVFSVRLFKSQKNKQKHSPIAEAKEIISDGSDAEMVEMAKMELDEANEQIPQIEEEIKYFNLI